MTASKSFAVSVSPNPGKAPFDDPGFFARPREPLPPERKLMREAIRTPCVGIGKSRASCLVKPQEIPREAFRGLVVN